MDFNGSQENGSNNAENGDGRYTPEENKNGFYSDAQYNSPQYGSQPNGANPYGNPYGGVPGYVPQPMNNPNNGFAVTALVVGIASILLCCCYGMGAVAGVVAIVFAVLSKKRNGGIFSGLATAGLVCGIVGTVLSAAWIVYYVFYGAALSSLWMTEYYNF